MLDESLSLGVLGATGRGATEHCGVPVSLTLCLLLSRDLFHLITLHALRRPPMSTSS